MNYIENTTEWVDIHLKEKQELETSYENIHAEFRGMREIISKIVDNMGLLIKRGF